MSGVVNSSCNYPTEKSLIIQTERLYDLKLREQEEDNAKDREKFKKFWQQYQEISKLKETDFIEYLNTVLYPDKPSKKIKTLCSFDDEVPEGYKRVPRYNF